MAVSPPRVAADLMDPSPPAVLPTARVGEIALALLKGHLSGVPVVAESGEVVGVVRLVDLVERHARVHFPVYIVLLGAPVNVTPWRSEREFQEEARHVLGRTAADVMTADIDDFVVDEDTPVEDVAEKLAREHVDPVIVLRHDRLAGLITRTHLVRLVAIEEGAAPTPAEGADASAGPDRPQT
jgi:CBS domain-containing protein